MHKKTIAIFFTTLFMALIMAPTVIVALDESIDTSIFYSITEEEENGKVKSKVKSVVSPFSLVSSETVSRFNLKSFQVFSYKFKTYPKPHLNLISPPPEHFIL